MGLIQDPAGWDDWRWGGRARSGGGTVPSFAAINGTAIYGYLFANGDELHYPEMQLPHDYKEGTDLVPHIHWVPTTSATYTGTWTLNMLWWLEVTTGTAISAVQTVTVTFNSALTAYQMQTADFSANLTGTNRKISSILFARLALSLSAGSSCLLTGLDAHYQGDTLGSVQVAAKT